MFERRPSEDLGSWDDTEENQQEEITPPARHTGLDLSPLSQYLDKLQLQASSRGEALQVSAPGPAVLAGATLAETFREPRRAEREKENREREALVGEAWPKMLLPDQEVEEIVADVIRQEKRKIETEWYMKGRPRRIKNMRLKNKRIRGVGIPRKMWKVMGIKELDDLVWGSIDAARHLDWLECKAGKIRWEDYKGWMEAAQKKMDERYKQWHNIHKDLPLAPMWEDENVTYPVRNRMRKYLDETFYKVTYHSHGIPHFHDKPRAPRIVPPAKEPHRYELTPCFQCQYRGKASRCKLKGGGCSSCQRNDERCLSLNPLDIREVKRGKLKLEQARGWWVEDGMPETMEGDTSAEGRKDQREANRMVRWFREGRWDVMEWVGGEKGFVRRNVKKDSWALPRFEKDETGRPEKDEKGKPIPYRS